MRYHREYLFAYGTLRRESNSEMFRLLARYGQFVDDATCQGKLYMVDTILVSSLQITRMILCTAKFTNSVAQISSYPVLMTMKNVALSLPSRLHMYGAMKMCKPRVAKSLPHGSTFTIVLPNGCN